MKITKLQWWEQIAPEPVSCNQCGAVIPAGQLFYAQLATFGQETEDFVNFEACERCILDSFQQEP